MVRKNIFNEDWNLSNEITVSLIRDLIKKRDDQIKAKLIELGIPTDTEYLINNCELVVGPNRRHTLVHKGQSIITWNDTVKRVWFSKIGYSKLTMKHEQNL